MISARLISRRNFAFIPSRRCAVQPVPRWSVNRSDRDRVSPQRYSVVCAWMSGSIARARLPRFVRGVHDVACSCLTSCSDMLLQGLRPPTPPSCVFQSVTAAQSERSRRGAVRSRECCIPRQMCTGSRPSCRKDVRRGVCIGRCR